MTQPPRRRGRRRSSSAEVGAGASCVRSRQATAALDEARNSGEACAELLNLGVAEVVSDYNDVACDRACAVCDSYTWRPSVRARELAAAASVKGYHQRSHREPEAAISPSVQSLCTPALSSSRSGGGMTLVRSGPPSAFRMRASIRSWVCSAGTAVAPRSRPLPKSCLGDSCHASSRAAPMSSNNTWATRCV